MNSVLRGLIQNHTSLLGKKEATKFVKQLNSKEKIAYAEILADTGVLSISKTLFNDSPSSPSFQKFRNRLFFKLIKSYQNIDKGTTIQKNKIEIWRMTMVCKVLGIFGLKNIWVKIAHKLIKKCENVDLHYEKIDLCRMLFKYYSTQNQRLELANFYFDEFNRCLDIYQCESLAEWNYCKANYYLQNSPVDVAKLKIQTILETNNSIILNSHRLEFYKKFVEYIYLYLEGESQKILEFLNDTINHFEKLNFSHSLITSIFRIELIKYLIEQNDFKIAKKQLMILLSQSTLSERNLYRNQELLLRIYLYTADIPNVLECYNSLTSLVSKSQEVNAKRRLLIYEMYLNLLMGKPVNFRRIRYNLNKMKSDKDEIYIPFIVGELIYNFFYNKDLFLDSVEATYLRIYRNFNSDKYKRTIEFLKILIKISQRKDWEYRLNQYYKISNNSVEIVDYNYWLRLIRSNDSVQINYLNKEFSLY